VLSSVWQKEFEKNDSVIIIIIIISVVFVHQKLIDLVALTTQDKNTLHVTRRAA